MGYFEPILGTVDPCFYLLDFVMVFGAYYNRSICCWVVGISICPSSGTGHVLFCTAPFLTSWFTAALKPVVNAIPFSDIVLSGLRYRSGLAFGFTHRFE